MDVVDGSIVITRKDGSTHTITYSQHTSPTGINCTELGATLVLESSGVFLTRAALQPFFDSGAKKVVVSAPVKDANPVLNIVYGVNHVSKNTPYRLLPSL